MVYMPQAETVLITNYIDYLPFIIEYVCLIVFLIYHQLKIYLGSNALKKKEMAFLSMC